jgi:hypothetical protein
VHFLTNAEARHTYIGQVRRAVCPGGFVVIPTFSLDSPPKCSGLEACRHIPEALLSEFGPCFQLMECRSDLHRTPSGTTQAFLYC